MSPTPLFRTLESFILIRLNLGNFPIGTLFVNNISDLDVASW